MKGRKTTNLVRINVNSIFIVRLIANKYYQNTFYFLSSLLTIFGFCHWLQLLAQSPSITITS